MFQKEVADRLVSVKGKKTYSRISVLTQWSCKTKYLFTVPNTAFIPRPKVQSSVVMLKPRLKPLYPAKMVYLQKVLKACFGYRRKMLKTSLSYAHPESEKILSRANINKNLRAEDLSIKQFCDISVELEKLKF